jgi:hypothetical protein
MSRLWTVIKNLCYSGVICTDMFEFRHLVAILSSKFLLGGSYTYVRFKTSCYLSSTILPNWSKWPLCVMWSSWDHLIAYLWYPNGIHRRFDWQLYMYHVQTLIRLVVGERRFFSLVGRCSVDVWLVYSCVHPSGNKNLLFVIAFYSRPRRCWILSGVRKSGSAKVWPFIWSLPTVPFSSPNARGDARVRDVFRSIDKTGVRGRSVCPHEPMGCLLQSARWLGQPFQPLFLTSSSWELAICGILFLGKGGRELSRAEVYLGFTRRQFAT